MDKMQKLAKFTSSAFDTELMHTKTGVLREDSSGSSVTHSGKFGSEQKSTGLISLDGEEFDGHDDQESKSLASEHIMFALREGNIQLSKKQEEKLKKKDDSKVAPKLWVDNVETKSS